MGILAFIAQIVSALAWPVTILILFLVFREQMLDMLRVLRKLKWGELEAVFGRELVRAREIIDQRPERGLPAITSPDFPSKDQDFLIKLSGLSPRSVVLEAWRQVESAAIAALKATALNYSNGRHSSALAGRALLDAHLIDDADYQAFSILRDLRNRASHEEDFEISQHEAIEYAILAQRIQASLRSSH